MFTVESAIKEIVISYRQKQAHHPNNMKMNSRGYNLLSILAAQHFIRYHPKNSFTFLQLLM